MAQQRLHSCQPETPPRRLLGIMSGTSADGLDLALIDVSSDLPDIHFQVKATASQPYSTPLRREIHRLIDADSCRFADLTRLHHRWAVYTAAAIKAFLRAKKIPLHSLDAIASHGQTIAHHPRPRNYLGRKSWGTLQIGDPSVLAQQTRCTVVGDFRWADIGAGGSGAPLSGYYHYLMLAQVESGPGRRAPLAVLNIGGIANISVTHRTRKRFTVIAFDCGPGNSLSDALMRRWGRRQYDRDGTIAKHGTIMQETLTRMKRHGYFRRKPPKSCGKEEFGATFIDQYFPKPPRDRAALADRISTVDELAAWAIAGSCRWLGRIGGIIVVGGGRHNKHLIGRLRDMVDPRPLISADYLGIPGDYVEAIGFALLANETLHGRPGNLGGATGGHSAVLGKICYP